MKNKLQCKDIPTLPILDFINQCNNKAPHINFCGDFRTGRWCNWIFNDEFDVHVAFPKDIPDKLLLAKMNSLIKKKYITGCACGCRGDFEITQKGIDFLSENSGQ